MQRRTNHPLQPLAQRVEAITSAGRPSRPIRRVATGWPAVDAVLGGGLIAGAVHEWVMVDVGGAQADGVMPLAVWMHLVRQAMGRIVGGVCSEGDGGPTHCNAWASGAGGVSEGVSGRWSVWIGRRCFAYPQGLMGEDGRLLARSLWVDPPDLAGRLWAMDLAARSPAVAVVVADGQGLDMAATRRLQLAAQAGGSLVLLGRLPAEQKQLSAAATRWRVRSAVGGTGDVQRWAIELLRCKGSQRGTGMAAWLADDQASGGQGEWIVEAKVERGQGLVLVPAERGNRSAKASASPSGEPKQGQQQRRKRA